MSMTIEEFEKNKVRYFDYMRIDNNSGYKGEHSCRGVECFASDNRNNQDCIFNSFNYGDVCMLQDNNLLLAEEKLQEWLNKRPIVTNRDKFREVFGIDISQGMDSDCAGIDCPNCDADCDTDCTVCDYKNFWSNEYKEQKKLDEKEDEDKNEMRLYK